MFGLCSLFFSSWPYFFHYLWHRNLQTYLLWHQHFLTNQNWLSAQFFLYIPKDSYLNKSTFEKKISHLKYPFIPFSNHSMSMWVHVVYPLKRLAHIFSCSHLLCMICLLLTCPTWLWDYCNITKASQYQGASEFRPCHFPTENLELVYIL